MNNEKILNLTALLIQTALDFKAELDRQVALTGKSDKEIFAEIKGVLDENDRLGLEFALELQAMIAANPRPFTPNPTEATP